jgi:hypothetical protein
MWFVLILNLLIRGLLFNSPDSSDKKEDSYEIIKKGDHMELSERWIKMGGTVDSREVRMVMTVWAGTSDILETLRNEQKGAYWNVNSNRFHVKVLDNKSWISFIEYQLPFPMNNRACYFLHEAKSIGSITTIHFKTLETDLFSKGKSLEIILGLEGKWVIEDRGDYSLLSYHIISVPDKSMPRWLVDPIVRKNMWSSMEKLRTTIERK